MLYSHRVAKNDRNSASGTWDEALVAQVGAAAKRFRGSRSAKWLSDRTAELGYPISPQIIARLDTGKRAGHFELAELLVLAKALEVPPVLLLFPVGVVEEIEVLPGHVAAPWAAYKWFIGDASFPWSPAGELEEHGSGPVDPVSGMHRWYDDPEQNWHEGAAPISLYHRHEQQMEAWFDANIRAARLLGDDASRASEMGELVSTWRRSAERELVDVRTRLRDLGLTPPKLDDRLQEIIDQMERR